jgi:hypothetical protein
VRQNPELPVHFFTIVLNGEPFIRYHLDVFKKLPFRWHWHVIEGAAALVHDTAWSVAAGGRLEDASHASGLSTDGTTGYLDAVAAADPDLVSLYRPPPGSLWNGKREMVSAPLPNIRESASCGRSTRTSCGRPTRSAQCADCSSSSPTERPRTTGAIAAPEAVLATRHNYAADPDLEWLRVAFPAGRPLDFSRAASSRSSSALWCDRACQETPLQARRDRGAGAVFQHFAYATEERSGSKRATTATVVLEGWRRLQNAVKAVDGPVRPDFFPWVRRHAHRRRQRRTSTSC